VIIETLLEGVRKGPSLLFRKECFDNTRIFDYQNSKSLHPLDHFTRWITSPAGSLHPLDHPQSQAEPTIIGFYTSIPAIPAIPAIQAIPAITTQARSAAFSKAHTMPLRRGVLGTSPALMPRRNSRIAARHACFSAGMATMA
jgi:hypothetical protein